MAKKIFFDWEYEEVGSYGKIFRPYVPVQLKTIEAGWKPFDFIVDSGADVTMLPYSMADILGLDLNEAEPGEATGIGGYRLETWQTKIPIRIQDWEFKVAVTITSDNLTPLLLGRVGTLDRKFSWIFDHKKEQIVFRRE